MPFTADEPPRTLPRGQVNWRLLALGWATVLSPQSYEDLVRPSKYALSGVSGLVSARARVRNAGEETH